MKNGIVIVNDQDEVIGHKERGTIAQDDIYRVSALWVTNSNGDILLAQRHHTKKHARRVAGEDFWKIIRLSF